MRLGRARGALAAAALVLLAMLCGPAVVGRRAVELQVGATAAAAETSAEGPEAAREPAEPEHEKPTFSAGKLALQILNFGALVFLLVWFGGKAVNRALLARHEQLKADLASAAEARASAEARLQKHEARLASLEQEIAGIRAGIKEEAEAEKARLIAAAEERAQRIREETAFMLDQQVKEAEAQLKREAVDASIKVAEELLRVALDGHDQQRMVDAFVRQVATSDGEPATPPPSPGGSSGGPRAVPRSEV